MAGSTCTIVDACAASHGRLKTVTFTCLTDDTDGTCTGTTTGSVVGLIYGLKTNPGSAAPTDNYDITITDVDGVDVLGGVGADRDTSNSEYAAAKDGAGNVVPIPSNSALTINVSNAGNAKTLVATLFYLPL